MADRSKIKIWLAQAEQELGGRTKHQQIPKEKFVYDDVSNSGHLYWWVDGAVASCPVDADGTLDLGNIGLVDGDDHGAEYDIYGRECLIVAALADRFDNELMAEIFRDRALKHFQMAEDENCMLWPVDERPPVGA
jgi:hypothetical protein